MYTSSTSIKSFGKDSLIDFYEEMSFAYSLEIIKHDEDTNELIYLTTIDATERKLRFPYVIENDTVKVVFKNLNKQEPFPTN